MKAVLTDLFVKNLKPDGRQRVYWCSRSGIALRVNQSGTKTFFVAVGADRKRINLGRYPQTSLGEARKRAQNLDPSPTLSIDDAKTLYLAHIAKTYRPRSGREVGRHLSRLHGITTKDVTDFMDTLPPSEANHFFGVCRTFFNWCERRDLFPNPVRKLKKPYKEQSRDRVLSHDEIRRVWTALGDDTFSVILKLCLLTGQRRGEIAAIQTSWISSSSFSTPSKHPTDTSLNSTVIFSNPCLTIPKEITKNKREHTVPLSALAVTAISELIATQNGALYNTWSRPKADLDKRSGVSNWTIHDLRRTFSTYLAEMATPPHIIDTLLNHQSNPLRARYNRYQYLPEMREALEAWEKRLLEITS